MVICTDMDGVWSDYNYGFSLLGYGEGYLPHVLSNKEIDKWEWVYELFNPYQLNRLMAKVTESGKFWEELPPVSLELGVGTLRSLIQRGHKFCVLTARPGNKNSIKHQTKNWFAHFADLAVSIGDIHICERGQKMDYLKKLKADVFIDDCPATIEEMNTRPEKMFAMEHKYNLHLKQGCDKVKFVRNTSEFFAKVRDLVN